MSLWVCICVSLLCLQASEQRQLHVPGMNLLSVIT